MFFQENKIAQAEFNVYKAKFNRPAPEGVTVAVPNIIDNTLAALRNMLAARAKQAQPRRSATYARGVLAK